MKESLDADVELAMARAQRDTYKAQRDELIEQVSNLRKELSYAQAVQAPPTISDRPLWCEPNVPRDLYWWQAPLGPLPLGPISSGSE